MNPIYCTVNHNVSLVACLSGLLGYYYSKRGIEFKFQACSKSLSRGWKDVSVVKNTGLLLGEPVNPHSISSIYMAVTPISDTHTQTCM